MADEFAAHKGALDKITLMGNLARYFGEKARYQENSWLWEREGLCICADDAGHFILASYFGEIVVSTVPDHLCFVPGPWELIVDQMKEEIEAAQKKRTTKGD